MKWSSTASISRRASSSKGSSSKG